MGFSPSRSFTTLTLLLALPLGAQDRDLLRLRRDLPARENSSALQGEEADRPDLRRDWNLWWFGGKLSPDYLDYKNRLAARELQRWGALMPQAPGAKPLPAVVGAAAAPAGTGGTWVNLGPTANLVNATWPDHDSGRPSAIAVDPGSNTLYLATSGGGVWKCANADPAATTAWTWTPITDGLPAASSSGNVSVGALALSPASAQTVYLGLGDAFDAEGRGFYKSTDGGTTWTESTGIGAQTRSYEILALDANVVLWGTNDGLKRSTNGGASFVPVTGGPATGRAWSIQAFSATELVCSAQDSKGVGSLYYSTDAGASWTLATLSGLGTITPGRMTLAAVPSGTAGYAEVEDTTGGKVGRGVLATADKGHTWTWKAAPTATGGLFQGTGPSMTSDGGQEWYNHAIAVDPANGNHLIMGANLAMYRSLDGGTSWQQMTHWYGSGHVYSHADFHTTATKGGIIYVGNDGGLSIFKDPWRATIPTTNPDLTFVDSTRNLGLATHLVYNVGSTTATNVTDGKYRISLGLQDNGTRIRQDVGAGLAASSTFEDQIGGDGFGTVVNPTDGNLMLGSIYYTQIYKSTNGGTSSFTSSSTGITESNNSSNAPFQPRLVLGDTAHPNTVYTATNGTVYQSTNFGTSWTGLGRTNLPAAGTSSTSDPSNALYIRNVGAAAGDPNALGIAANQGRVFLSYNGGSSWTQAGTLTNNGSYTSSIWFDRTNSQTVYVASVAPDATKNHLWKSTNGGSSWSTLDGTATTSNGFPFGIPVHVVVTDPVNANTVYAGTDFGVYYSIDGGSNWARFGSSLPMVAVRDLYIAPDGSFLRAATFGRGVWELQTAAAGITVALDRTTATVAPSGTTTFTAAVTNFKTDNTVNWTVSAGGGSVSPANTASGTATTYTAPATVGLYTVTAASNESPTATATATVGVYNPAAVTVTVSPATSVILAGDQLAFTATVANAPSTNVTWAATGGVISSTGVFLALPVAGTFTVTATSTWAGTTPGTATVIVKSPDLNGDSVVDGRDLLFFAKYYGTANATCDLNGDGIVDDKDLALLLGRM
ncbi:MAG TPA: dockerin type I domain-containing protein [Holophagaceae bacterium]